MKRHILALTGFIVTCLFAAGLLIMPLITQTDIRGDYEQFLVQEYTSFPIADLTAGEKEPAMDRPDLASFTDYIKTMDPELKAVPAWRLAEGLEHSKALQAKEGFKSASGDISWTAHPTDMGGRTRTLMFDPNDSGNMKVWAGSVTGGLWVNEDPFGNTEWEPVDDFWANLSISTMTYDPNNTHTFYVGTGESQTALIIYRESSGRGSGIYRSKDAGETWAVIPSTKDWAYVTDILVRDEDEQSVIYAGVISGKYKGANHQSTPTDGLFRSTDDGESWTQVMPNIAGESVPYAPSDIETSSDKKRIFVGTTYNLDGKGGSCLLYSDDGINWSLNSTYHDEIIDGKSISGNSREYTYPGRVMFSNAPSNPDIMYSVIAGGYVRSDLFIGYDCVYVLKSIDKGQTWSNLSIPMRDSQNTFAYLAWHALVIQVSPNNPNLIWLGGLDTWRSVDAGASWTLLSYWGSMYGGGSTKYVHADIHSFKFRPGSYSDMLIATDGGIFGTKTASSTDPIFYEYNKGYSTLQYYSGAIHPDAGAIHFVGGLQDNGTMFYKKDNVPTFRDMLSGGDGALCFIDQDDPNIHLTTVYHSSVYLYNAEKEQDPVAVKSRGFDDGTFINAMDYDWRDNVLFANGQREEGTNPNTLLVVGVTSSDIRGSLQDMETNSTVPYSCIKWSEHSPLGKINLFIGTQAGKLFKLDDDDQIGGTIVDLTSPEFPTGNISCIDIGQSEDTLLVTFSNYGVASVWLSVDGGQNWQNKDGDLPDMPVRWALFHPENSDQVMLATELGTWSTNKIQNKMVIWSPKVNGMANVRIDQIKIRTSDNTVLAATHGRGMFTGVWNVDYTSGIVQAEMVSDIVLYPNPSKGEFHIEFQSNSTTELVISDLEGRIVFYEKFEPSQSIITKPIDLRDQGKGLYLISLNTAFGKKTSKLIFQ